MSEHEEDRIAIELKWPTRVQYSTLDIRLEHSFYPGEDREKAIDFMVDKITDQMNRQMDRIAAALTPTRPPNGDPPRRP
jgi:hypothetical protein